jgi:DNA modification methylase
LAKKAWVYFCGGWTNISLYAKMFEYYLRLVPRVIVWDKQSMTMRHNGYHSSYEFIFVGYTEGAGDVWFGSRAGEAATDVWRIAKPTNNERQHLTEKPVELPERAMGNSCPPNGIVWDPFLGSGTTLIACERLCRRCRAIEISPAYCAVSIQRWVDMTGGEPELINA